MNWISSLFHKEDKTKEEIEYLQEHIEKLVKKNEDLTNKTVKLEEEEINGEQVESLSGRKDRTLKKEE